MIAEWESRRGAAQVWGRGRRGAKKWIGSKLDVGRLIKGFQKERGRRADYPVLFEGWWAKERDLDTERSLGRGAPGWR